MKQKRGYSRMNNVIYQKSVTFMIIVFAVSFIIQFTGIQSSRAQDWFNVSASDSFMPEAGINNTDVGLSYNQFEVKVSALVLELTYSLTSFSWNKVDTLPLGNGTDDPWEQLHHLSFQAMYGDDMSERWAYLIFGKGLASFEEKIDESFFEGTLVSGLKYMLSEEWDLLFGGGIKYNDFEMTPFPVGGFQWDTGRGVSLSVIFPLESKINYKSANETLSASVDFFFDPSAEITYRLFPSLEVGLSYFLSKGSLYKLSDDSPVEPVDIKKYLETDAQVASLGFRYSPFEHLTCDIGMLYHFSREFSILDEDENTIEELDVAASFGGTFSLIYTF